MGAWGRLLAVDQAAELLGTGERFVRRLIAERRIPYVHVGRHVRIPEAVIDEYINTHTIQPLTRRSRGRAA